MNSRKYLKHSVVLVCLLISLLLTACNDTNTTGLPDTPRHPTIERPAETDTPPAEDTPPVLATATATPVVTPTNIPKTTATITADPVVTLPPAPTVAIATPSPTAVPTPTKVLGGYGVLPTPPRTLNPKTDVWSTAPKPFQRNSFIAGTSNGLYIFDAQGQNEKLLVGGAAFSNPTVAPDGSQIAVFRTDPLTKKKQMVLVDTAGGVKPLTAEGTLLAAAWSPDSKTLALTETDDTNNDGIADEFDSSIIVLYTVATGKAQNVGAGQFAAWSPDGVRIAYIIPGKSATTLDPTTRQLQRGQNGVGIYNITNKGQRDLIESKDLQVTVGGDLLGSSSGDQKLDVRYFKAVTWHPDSTHITATADATGPNGLRTGLAMTMTLEDATPKLLTAGGDAANQIVWSPDGNNLIFETQPQYPVGPKSAAQVAIDTGLKPDAALPTKTLIGSPATRSEAHAPAWVEGGQAVAFLQGDHASLTITDLNGQNPQALISDCLGFAWF